MQAKLHRSWIGLHWNPQKILTPLTCKEFNNNFPIWTNVHQYTFNTIKQLVVSWDCLTMIDHETLGENKIFVTCNTSKWRTGAILTFGKTWESTHPIAFESRQLNCAECNYPMHEQEMLIMRAVKKWWVDLLGTHINIYTDHKTLQNFNFQCDLSQHQAHWMEYLSQYKYSITYINGEKNTVADALPHLPDAPCAPNVVSTIFSIESDPNLLIQIKDGYQSDPWCRNILDDKKKNLLDEKSNILLKHGLLFIGQCMIIPQHGNLWECLFHLAHDSLGHFRSEKSYAALRDNFYWPNMRKNLTSRYVLSCQDWQRNKSTMHKPAGPLHPLPIHDKRFKSIMINFISLLTPNNRYDGIVTMTDQLGADIQIIPCKTNMSAEEFASVFFDQWYCENGCPSEIISDRDKLFISKFWHVLMKITRIKHKLSTTYHPQTDGTSKRSNKTVIQCLCFHIKRNQCGLARVLSKVRFHIMNTINASTGLTPFMLKMGWSPWCFPPLIPNNSSAEDKTPKFTSAHQMIESIENYMADARDALLHAKLCQAHKANKDQSLIETTCKPRTGEWQSLCLVLMAPLKLQRLTPNLLCTDFFFHLHQRSYPCSTSTNWDAMLLTMTICSPNKCSLHLAPW